MLRRLSRRALAAALAAGHAWPSARPSRSSGRSKAPATSSRATPRASRWTRRAACAWPPRRARCTTPRRRTSGALARDGKGRALRGHRATTGKVFRIEDGTGATRLRRRRARGARPRRGRRTAASTPAPRRTARSTRSTRRARPTTFFDPDDKYIWALAFDAQGRLLVATGARGQGLPRGPRRARREVLLAELRDPHHRARRRTRAGNVYAGSSPGGILYRIDAAGKVFVLHDSPFREVKALEVGADGSVYAAVIDGEDRDESTRPAPAAAARAAARRARAGGEVTVTESFSDRPARRPPPRRPSPRPLEPARPGPTQGRGAAPAALGRGRHPLVLDRGDAARAGRASRTACWWAPATRASSTASATTAPGPWSRPSPPSR